MPWAELIKILPDVIKEAAKSQLGILALIILGIGTLAFLFFRDAPVAVRVAMFLVMFGGACAFARAVVREIPPTTTPPPAPVDVSGEWEGQGPTEAEDVRRHFQYVFFPPGNMTFSFVSKGNGLQGTLHLRKRHYRAFDTDYGLLEGRIEGQRVFFAVHSEFAVNDAPKVAIERFTGDVDGDRIRFTLQEDTGYPPLEFTAVRRP